MRRFLLSVVLVTFMLVTSTRNASSQCAMCKQNAESSLKEGNTNAKGLNLGIMYLLVIPYILVGGIGYYWYVNHKKNKDSTE